MKILMIALVCGLLAVAPRPARALGQPSFVTASAEPGAFALARPGTVATLLVDLADHAGVLHAARALQDDIERVSAQRPVLRTDPAARGADVVVIGTLGKSALIDRLVSSGKLDPRALLGRWEAWRVQVVIRPWPGVERALVIAGSDKRGTIYGLYELSEQIGVSPWAWWADVPVRRQASLFVAPSTSVGDAPVVRYRGIFLNDEAPALTGWARERFGGYNHHFYVKVFELILRLRGNLLWPAMWQSAFYDDDPLNGRLADEYGIVMGTSHHEPMMRAQQEWHRRGGGAWDYATNGAALREFWADGLRTTRGFETLLTIGMRGDGDTPMSGKTDVALLEQVVIDQRALIARELGADASRKPQVWALYKEVQDYHDQGMRVPDDVLQLWCDDNWGNLRRLPTAAERRRAGGAGVYYHFDYVGVPRSYKWINVTPIPKVWEQMHLAWRHEATRMWIVNVGDLKPMEVPTEFFLSYAWNPAAWPADRLDDYLRLWATREFGPEHAAEIADIVAQYTRFNGRRKPEMLEPTTYSLVHYNEAERVVTEYNAIAERAERIAAALPAESRDAFYQLVLYPAQAGAVVNEMYVAAGLNRLFATQGRSATNVLAERVRALFRLDAELTRRFHEDIAGGKWQHMMSQVHLGYTRWNDPPRNAMPAVTELQLPAAGEMGVAVEGSDRVWPGHGVGRMALPALNRFDPRTRFVELFNRGREPYEFVISTSQPWVTLSTSSGRVGESLRVQVGVRWAEVPAGHSQATLTVSGPRGARATIDVPLHNLPAPGSSFIEIDGVVAIEAEHHARAVAPAGRHWLRVPGHGRTLSGMTTLPVDGPALAVTDGMRLEYLFQLFGSGKLVVHTTLAPTQKFRPGPGLRFAVSIDDETPRIVDLHADDSRRAWERSVSDGAVSFATEHAVDRPGAHTLAFWALDPGVVVHKLVVDVGGLKPSYLGPPESPRAP
ncbi:MAG: glycosyl hydrolase 115 family protein [Burkholderiales bacterium]|nr:glycosyl hydrolase 115 family protein [Burkholderiales bacterium]